MPNVIFFAYWIWNMGIEIIKMILNAGQYKLFRFITLGRVNEDKFKAKYMSGIDSNTAKENDEDEDENNDYQDPALKYIVSEEDENSTKRKRGPTRGSNIITGLTHKKLLKKDFTDIGAGP